MAPGNPAKTNSSATFARPTLPLREQPTCSAGKPDLQCRHAGHEYVNSDGAAATHPFALHPATVAAPGKITRHFLIAWSHARFAVKQVQGQIRR